MTLFGGRKAYTMATARALLSWALLAAGAGSMTAACAQPVVTVGLERVAEGADEALRDKRIGLIVHSASVTEDGLHAIEVFRQRDLNVVRIFSPEHGLRGSAGAGEKVDSGTDPESGLPVVSLYGKSRRPSGEDLAGLDTLVFDLQGAGVRFYTYASTMIYCLEAAAEGGLEFVVLDRPNPLGGDRVEGPVSAARDVVAASFVNRAPGPLVHGLTLGEMARIVNAGLARPAPLRVVEMKGWERSMTWSDTGRSWVPPSPNLRSPEAALAYPGIALLEGTNVSEGRGTPTPFLLLGAPWLSESAESIPAIEGFELESAMFVPAASAAARYPKFDGQECHGYRVVVTDGRAARPYLLGLAIVKALSRQQDFEWLGEGENLTRLLGTPKVLASLRAETSLEEILAADDEDHAAWRTVRKPYLLY